MKQRLILFLSLAVFYTSCSDSAHSGGAAKGDKVYGGTLRVNEIEQYQTLYPAGITDVTSYHIANQVYEGLVKFNPKDLAIKPCLAEKWDVDASATTYTFYLKKGVKFHDDACFSGGKGREVKATDVEQAFKLLCINSKENVNFPATFKDRVVGANAFYEAGKDKAGGEIEGIKVMDDYTIKISLTEPSASFLYALALPAASIIPKEAVEKYGIETKVGTGPFIFAGKNTNERVILRRNENYHGVDSLGNQLPFLDTVIISFFPTKKEELDNFKNGNLSIVIGLSSEAIKDMVEKDITDFQNKPPKYILDRSAEMATQYYTFNLTRPPFNDVRVRKAFSYALKKNRIIEEVLRGEAYGPGVNGISPPSFKGYDITKIKGYDFDEKEAKKLLAEAGYPDGKGFPLIKIELNSGGSKSADVVLEIQKQLMDVLNVNVDFEVVSLKQKLDDEKHARADMFRASWLADFPSPENFLWILYGASVPEDVKQPSWPNTPRYKNPEFDKLFEAGKSAKNQEESYADFMKAEQILMEDAPIIVLWYGENYRLVKSNVRSFFSNPMRHRDYSEVYIKEVTSAVNTKENAEGEKKEGH